MKKQFLLIGLMVFLFASCDSDATKQEIEPTPIDAITCLEAPDTQSMAVSPEGLINGHILAPNKAIVKKDAKLTDSRFPYVINPEFHKQEDRDIIQSQIDYVASVVPGIEFVGYESEEAMRANESHGFIFNPDLNNSGYIGHLYDFQPINLSFSFRLRSENVAHFIGHALSLGDESSKPNRDDYVQVYFENLPDGFDYFEKYGEGYSTCNEDYDYNALVTQHEYQFNNNGEDSDPIIRDLNGKKLSTPTEYSEVELEVLNAMYPDE